MPADVDFWDWLSTFTNDEWNYLIAYLWRISPTTDRRFNGKASHIRKYGTKFDLERIKLEEGSGGYRIDLCKQDPATGASKRICQHFFQIMDMSYPPRVPVGEWLNDPENEMWRWAEEPLKVKAAEASAEAQGKNAGATAAVGADPNSVFNTVLSGIRTLRGDAADNNSLASAVLQMVQSNQEQMMALTDPAKQLNTLKELIAAVTPPVPASNGEAMVIQILRDELKATREEVRELRNEKTKTRGFLEELLDNLPKVQQLAASLGFKKGTGHESTDWGSVVSSTVDKLSDHVPLILDAIRSRDNPAAGVGGWGALQPRPVPRATRPPSSAANPNDTVAGDPAAAAAGAGGNGEPSEEDKQRMQAMLSKYGGLIGAVAPFLIDQYKAGLTGYDFRDWFLSRHGMLNWTGLRDEVGPENLTGLAQFHPHLKVALAPPERLLAFLKEFFTEPGQEPAGVVQPDNILDNAPPQTINAE